MTNCPLCGTQASINTMAKPDFDLASVQCPACGTYYVDDLLLVSLNKKDLDVRSRLSMVCRSGSDARNKITILEKTIPELVSRARRPATIMESIDALLVLLGGRTGTDYLSRIAFNRAVDWPLLGARDAREIDGLLKFAVDLGFLQLDALIITIRGWQRIDELRANPLRSRRAFVAMWFDHQMDAVWDDGFVAGIENSGYFSAHRVDKEEHNQKVDDRIIAEIRRSGLVVADFTGHRGGVYFEAGYALGLSVPVIWTCRRDDIAQAHFDTRQYNHILWDNESDLSSALDARIRALYVPRGWGA